MSDSNKADKWQKIAEEAEREELAAESQDGSEKSSEVGGLDFPTRQHLEDQLTAMERQVDEYKQQALRAQSEWENFRKRAERDISNAHKYGIEKLIVALLPALDGLTHGLETAISDDPKVKAIHDGMQLTLDIFKQSLAKFGVEVIDPPVGEEFNPALHEAMTMRQEPGAKSNTILQVLQKGYKLHDRVLRAAMVVVAK